MLYFNINSPKKLSKLLIFLTIVFILLLYYPMSLIFNGDWQLQQKIDILNLTNFKLFDIPIPVGIISLRYYSIFILLGVVAGYILALFLSKKHNIVASIVDRLLLGLIVFGLLGARLFYVIFNWSIYESNLFQIVLGLSQGGLAIMGAIIGGLIYLSIYTKKFNLDIFEFLDFITPSLLLGQVIGRWGNFFNYEAYGPTTSVQWKMYVPLQSNITSNLNDRYFHPTFLYESGANLILLILILWNYSKLTTKNSGKVASIYLIGYGVIRFLLEFLRLDAIKQKTTLNYKWFIFDFSEVYISQFFALIMILTGLLIYYKRFKIKN